MPLSNSPEMACWNFRLSNGINALTRTLYLALLLQFEQNVRDLLALETGLFAERGGTDRRAGLFDDVENCIDGSFRLSAGGFFRADRLDGGFALFACFRFGFRFGFPTAAACCSATDFSVVPIALAASLTFSASDSIPCEASFNPSDTVFNIFSISFISLPSRMFV